MSDYTKGTIGAGYNSATNLNTELSAVESAVNSKVDESGGTLTGQLDMNSNKLLNVADGTNVNDGVNYGQLINGSSFAAADAKFIRDLVSVDNAVSWDESSGNWCSGGRNRTVITSHWESILQFLQSNNNERVLPNSIIISVSE